MSTSAELHGEVSHFYHPDLFTVFLAEQRHCTGLFCLLKAHNLSNHREIFGNFFVYQFLYLIQLFLCHSRKVAEVKPQSLAVHIGTGLLHMSAQHLSQCFLQQMGSAVVLTGSRTVSVVYGKSRHIPRLNHAPCNRTDMPYLAAHKLHGILHFKAAVRRGNHTDIRILAAHGGIERCLLHNNRTHIPVGQRLHQFRLRGQHRNLGIVLQPVIPYKFGSDLRSNGFIHGHIGSHIISHFTSLSRRLLLLLHTEVKAFLVNGKALFFQNLSGQIHGETIGIIKLKDILSGKLGNARRFHLVFHL